MLHISSWKAAEPLGRSTSSKCLPPSVERNRPQSAAARTCEASDGSTTTSRTLVARAIRPCASLPSSGTGLLHVAPPSSLRATAPPPGCAIACGSPEPTKRWSGACGSRSTAEKADVPSASVTSVHAGAAAEKSRVFQTPPTVAMYTTSESRGSTRMAITRPDSGYGAPSIRASESPMFTQLRELGDAMDAFDDAGAICVPCFRHESTTDAARTAYPRWEVALKPPFYMRSARAGAPCQPRAVADHGTPVERSSSGVQSAPAGMRGPSPATAWQPCARPMVWERIAGA